MQNRALFGCALVILGSGLDDFVVDAIISQLLLLDAKDYTKDIRLFTNFPGSSLRYRTFYLFVIFSKSFGLKFVVILRLYVFFWEY